MQIEYEIPASALRPWQLDFWNNQERFNILVVHRRAGKTVIAIMWLIFQVLNCTKPNPRGAYLAPLFRQAKSVAWQYVKDLSRGIPGVQFNESELRVIYPNGAEIRLLGASEPDGLRGLYLDAVVCDEVAQFAPRTWTEIIRPALADRKGHALMIGTVFGRANLFYDYWIKSKDLSGWYRKLLTYHDTDALDLGEVEEMRGLMDESEFEQEMLCNWDAGVKGSFYGKLMTEAARTERVVNVPYDPGLLVHTSWDLGMADSTVVIYWQRTRTGEVRAIDCDEYQNTGLSEIVRQMTEKDYTYGTHILPHDARVRELGTGKSRVEILRSLGINPTVAKNSQIYDGINAVRTLIPRTYFDESKCFKLIEALKTYRSDFNEERQVYNRTPLHTWESHFADAVRYFALTEDRLQDGGSFPEIDYSARVAV